MNVEVCKSCSREHCYLCFDFGDITTYEILFGLNDGRKAVVSTVNKYLSFDTKDKAHLVLEKKDGEICVSKYMNRWSSFFDWDECIKYGYPFKRFMDEGTLKEGDRCLCYTEQKIEEWNKEKDDEA